MNVGPSDFYVGFGWQSFGLHIKGQWWPSGPFSCYYTAAWHQSCACTETFIVSVVIILWILFTQCLKHGWFTYKCISDQLFSYWNFAYSVRNRDGLLIYFWSIIVFLLLAFWLAWNSYESMSSSVLIWLARRLCYYQSEIFQTLLVDNLHWAWSIRTSSDFFDLFSRSQ